MAHGPPTRGEARTCQPVVRRVGRVKCVAVFSARVWEREAFKADRADLDALASRGWHGGGAGGRRARLWDRSTALRPSTRASMARTTDWTLTQRGIADGRSLQGPAGHQGHGGPIPGRAAHGPGRPHRLAAALFATLRHARRRDTHPGTHPSTSDSPFVRDRAFPKRAMGVAPQKSRQLGATCSMRSLFLALSASGSSLSLR